MYSFIRFTGLSSSATVHGGYSDSQPCISASVYLFNLNVICFFLPKLQYTNDVIVRDSSQRWSRSAYQFSFVRRIRNAIRDVKGRCPTSLHADFPTPLAPPDVTGADVVAFRGPRRKRVSRFISIATTNPPRCVTRSSITSFLFVPSCLP